MIRDNGRQVAMTAAVSLAFLSSAAWGGHVSETSERLTGTPVPGIALVTLDGKPFSLAALRGHPVLVEVFASWCPPCQAVMQELRALYPSYSARGLRFVAVMVDPLVTPDSVPNALQMLKENPLPYPVVSVTPEFQRAFAYEGFPAVYFITRDGRFSTTVFGYNPSRQYEEAADRLLLESGKEVSAGASSTPPVSEPSSPHKQTRSRRATDSSTAAAFGATPTTQDFKAVSSRAHNWEGHPLRPLLPGVWKQWHPMAIHFPIALLFLEAGLLAAFYIRPRDDLRQFSRWVLWWAVLSFIPTIYTGVRDVGASLGADLAFWAGLKDRASNFFRIESAVSLHVRYGLSSVFVTGLRLLWRSRAEDQVLAGRYRKIYAAVTALGLWLLFAAGQVGGGISHE